MKIKIFLFLTVLVSSSTTTLAENNEHPDLSGYWMISFGPIPPNREPTKFEQSMLNELDKNTHLLADTGLIEFPPGNFGGLKITAAARAAAESYDIETQRQVSTTCQSPSVVYSMQGPFPMEIFQGRDLIVIKMEYFDVVRVIFMNETTHPEDWPHSITGHSIGRWDGDELVVETTKIQAATLLNNGLNHSDNIRLTERFRLSPDGKNLVITQEYVDPEVFAGKAARIIPVSKYDDHVYPYACDPSYGAAIENRGQQ